MSACRPLKKKTTRTELLWTALAGWCLEQQHKNLLIQWPAFCQSVVAKMLHYFTSLPVPMSAHRPTRLMLAAFASAAFVAYGTSLQHGLPLLQTCATLHKSCRCNCKGSRHSFCRCVITTEKHLPRWAYCKSLFLARMLLQFTLMCSSTLWAHSGSIGLYSIA